MKKASDKAIAIYSRKSRFTGKGESIDNQVELCKEYIRIHCGEEAVERAVVFEDEGFSGGNLNRPDFKHMMEEAKKHKFRSIIVYRLDRISRNIGDFAGLIDELSHLNVDFISIKEQFDTASPMGRAMMYIASVFSQLERETIAERIRDNMHELAKTGRWLGGTTPTGYGSEAVKRVTVDGKTKKACKLVLIPEEADIVRTVYALFMETDSLTETEAQMIAHGIKTKNGRDFTRFSIKSILKNPVYMIADEAAWRYFTEREADLFSSKEDFDGVHGIMAYNRTDQEKGRTTVNLPVEEWIVSVGRHPGIISGRDWVKVQASLERNKSKTFRKPRTNLALLTGLLECSCGSRMYPKQKKRLNADGDPVYFYVCQMKERSKKTKCNQKNVNGYLLDMAVIEEIKKLAEDKDEFLAQLESSRKFCTGSRAEYETRLDMLRAEAAEHERKINSLVDSLTDLGAGSARGAIMNRIETLSHEKNQVDERITELERLNDSQALNDSEFDVMRQLLASFRTSIDTMTVEQKRAVIRTLVRKVVWDGEYVHLVLFGTEKEEAEFPNIPAMRGGAEDEEGDDFKPIPDENVSNGDEGKELAPSLSHPQDD